MNTFSIIIPAYNAETFLAATIRSALRVSKVDAEIIVIDDGSMDRTPEICAKFGHRIRFRRVENGGVSRARNIGAGMASAEWLLFLDSDDKLDPEGPASLIRAATAAGAGVTYGLVDEGRQPPLAPRITGQGHAAGAPPHPALHNYWRCAIITPGSAVIRRDLHDRIGGFVPGFEPMEDRDYWIKAGLLEPCAHADSVVLDKTWRPVSAGKMNAERIWNGLRSRLDLPRWCEARGVRFPEQLPRDERTLFEKALNEAVWCKCWDLVGLLLHECRVRGIRSFWTMKAACEFALRGGNRCHPLPTWAQPITT